jgi:probable HAF family extracellular repeat protein
MTDLGTLTGDNGVSEAWDINDAGQVVGGAQTSAGYTHAFLYYGGGMTDLGALVPYGDSSANAINNLGQVVGDAAPNAGTPSHAFLYSAGSMVDLGTLAGDDSGASFAKGINDAGWVVGNAWTGSAVHAFLYDGAGMVDLNDLIDPSLGWTLQNAEAINNGGQIVGYGFRGDNEARAFLLTLAGGAPEPSAWAMMLIGFGAIGLVTRSRRSPAAA